MIAVDDRDDEFLLVAARTMAGEGAGALDALGWWELLPELADPEAREAVFTASRAQGRELASSPALGGIMAQPFIAGSGLAAGSVVAAIRRSSPRRGQIWTVVGEVDSRSILFDVPGVGAYLLEPDAVERRSVDVPGRTVVSEVTPDLTGAQLFRTDDEAARVRAESIYLGRVAAATEILGASERAVGLSVDYACVREQFGRPIGEFQAVRHLLAWAKTDCVAIDSLVRKASVLYGNPPARLDEVVKAIAGRNGRRACERSLQVLGGIGFTAEDHHHHFHSRVLALDALLGSSNELSQGLGAWLRTGVDPMFAATALVPRTD